MAHHLVGIAEIADMLGVSRQRVHQLIQSYEDFPEAEADLAAGRVWSRTAIEAWIAAHPERGGEPKSTSAELFEPLSGAGRLVLVLAQERARLLKHNYIGTEHLLLALVEGGRDPTSVVAARALHSFGATRDVIRSRVAELIGPGAAGSPQGHIPFTARAKNALDVARSEARKLGSSSVEPEHVLLGLWAIGEGVAYDVLAGLGVKEGKLRDRVAALVSEKAGPPGPTVMRCSFCGKWQEQVRQLVAGPAVYICNECIDLCNEIVGNQTPGEESSLAKRVEALEAAVGRLSAG